MTPGRVDLKVVADRVSAIRRMVAQLRSLSGGSLTEFKADFRNVAAAESILRRAIESLLDTARHLLARGFGIGALEYREIARISAEKGLVADAALGERFLKIAGFRNRLTHFYDEVTAEELYSILAADLEDLERLATAFEKTAAGLAKGPGG
jgi:uncharacterized protein YutE (UPF0331/DUF86 family)